jgi:hypothetical protein
MVAEDRSATERLDGARRSATARTTSCAANPHDGRQSISYRAGMAVDLDRIVVALDRLFDLNAAERI